MKNDPRSPSHGEMELLKLMLLHSGLPDSEINAQLDKITVEEYDNTGSLILHTTHSLMDKRKRILAEMRFPDAETADETDAHVAVILHARDGHLRMLEIFKEDGSRIIKSPISGEISII